MVYHHAIILTHFSPSLAALFEAMAGWKLGDQSHDSQRSRSMSHDEEQTESVRHGRACITSVLPVCLWAGP